MSSDKRRRARIQGGWSSASNNNTGKKPPQLKRPPVSFNTLNDQDNKEDSPKQEEYTQFLFTGSSNVSIQCICTFLYPRWRTWIAARRRWRVTSQVFGVSYI